MDCLEIEQWLNQLKRMVSTKKIDCIVIDGHCGSGKTTLAEWIANGLNASLVHMDDFYLPFALRNGIDDFPGNHMDYHRLQTEIIDPFKENQEFTFRPYDAHIDTYGPTIVCKNPLLIVEGSYSCHPHLKYGPTTYRLFMTIDPTIQKKRIIDRGGLACWEGFETRWIPKEQRYFDEYNISESCDQIIEYNGATIKSHES